MRWSHNQRRIPAQSQSPAPERAGSNIYRNGIQGLGYGLLPMMAGVAELTGRGIVAVIAGKMRSYPGVCLAGPAAWVLAGGLLLVMYFYIMNVHMKKVFGTNGKD